MAAFFTENYYKYHYASVCSFAFIFLIVLILLSILLPFFTNFGSLDVFWGPNKVFTDHPIVQFNNEFLIVLNYTNENSNKTYKATLTQANLCDENENIIITSLDFEKEEYSNKNIYSSIKFKAHLDNLKSTDSSIKIVNVQIYFFLDYYMVEDCLVHIRSNIHVPQATALPKQHIRKIESSGYINLKQNEPLVNQYFIDDENKVSFDEEVENILNNPLSDTSSQDYYLEFKKYYFITQKILESNDVLDIDISMTIPYYQDIIVSLPNYTNLKNKWVLYSMLFFPTLYICYRLMEFVIERQIFKSGIRSELPIKL